METTNSKALKLTEGPVLPALTKLALPIMGASFLEMAYSLTDLFWIGFMGHKALAGVGIAGFYMWLSVAFTMLAKVGTEIRVAHRTGARDEEGAKDYARTGLILGLLFALLFSFTIYLFRVEVIAFFGSTKEVSQIAVDYLAIIMMFWVFGFINPVFTGIFNARGDSATSFKVNTLGLIINMILDPILILGLFGLPQLGARGAAIATVLAQCTVTMIFLFLIFGKKRLFSDFHLSEVWKKRMNKEAARDILGLSIAPAIHSGFFTVIAIIIARMVANFGTEATAAQELGTQIESLSWLSTSGLSVAIAAFVGQNYGAKKLDRVLAGYKAGIMLAIIIGLITTTVLFFFLRFIFFIFVRDALTLDLGESYLKILALSQLFMCVEITSQGVFNGLGETRVAPVIAVSMNLIRIPIAYYLGYHTSLGLYGIWGTISGTSIMKGILLYIALRRQLKKKNILISLSPEEQAA